MGTLKLLVNIFTELGDSVLLFSPYYNYFEEILGLNNRKIVRVKMKIVKLSRYLFDPIVTEKAIVNHKIRFIILCNSHNPIGKVWQRDELLQLIDICKKYDVLLVSDEVYADLVLDGYKYNPIQNMSYNYNKIITLSSPTRAFNKYRKYYYKG